MACSDAEWTFPIKRISERESMIKHILERRIENLEQLVATQDKLINELLGGLTCESEEIRALIRDAGFSYKETMDEKYSQELQLSAVH